MKRADWMIVAVVLVLALASYGAYRFYFASTGDAAVVSITVDGKEYQTLPLEKDTEVSVSTDGGHKNIVQIKDKKVTMKEADCPDKICVKHRAICDNGESIICLPHKVVVTIQSSKQAELDGVAR